MAAPRLERGATLMIVTNLQGGCAYAEAFGELEGQTVEAAWRLIEAALDAALRVTSRAHSNGRFSLT